MAGKLDLDGIDRKLLAILQQDATVSIAKMADEVGLSSTPCWKRIRRLEAAGMIKRRVAILDRNLLGLGVTVIVAIRTSRVAAGLFRRYISTPRSY